MLQSDRNQITIICRSNYNSDGQFISLHSGPALYSGQLNFYFLDLSRAIISVFVIRYNHRPRETTLEKT